MEDPSVGVRVPLPAREGLGVGMEKDGLDVRPLPLLAGM
ncbi:hypothetical protein FHT02_002888 [Sphingomonas xinjiangensis]|uniref:Uncharacterized protein n=1 Tax=Sphingomonas xinjiangensis TaxID=643568 RepID=A0A840YDY5_9SPHN|nr:hypothetical protein [Sphingomonas xinjiangensis]